MQVARIDPRLGAACLTLEEFVGRIEGGSDIFNPDELLALYQNEDFWAASPELPLLFPVSGYSLRCKVPSEAHEVFLIHSRTVVGFFVETDSLVVRSDHQGKGLGSELILAAFAQKPWRSPVRKASPAGQKALSKAHGLACEAQRSLQAEGHASGVSAAEARR
jgi:GNAT superfamily N-acetyltransferase